MLMNNFFSCLIKNNELYFCISGNLMKVNLSDLHMKFLINLEQDISFTDEMIVVNEMLYMLDFSGKYLVVFNFETNDYVKFSIGCNGDVGINYICFFKYDNKLIIVPRYKQCVIEFDLISNSIYENYTIHNQLKKNNIKCLLWSAGTYYANFLWLTSHTENLLIRYDLETNNITIYKLSEEINRILDVFVFDNKVYLLDIFGNVFCWISEKEMLVKIFSVESFENEYGKIIVNESNIFLFPKYGDSILFFDRKSNKKEIYSEYPYDFSYKEFPGLWKYYSYCEDEEFYYFAMLAGNYMLCVSKKKKVFHWLKFYLPTEEERIKFYSLQQKTKFLENEIALKSFCELITSEDFKSNQIVNTNMIGVSIWNKILR